MSRKRGLDDTVFFPNRRVDLTNESGMISSAALLAAKSTSYKAYHGLMKGLPWAAAAVAIGIAVGKLAPRVSKPAGKQTKALLAPSNGSGVGVQGDGI